MSLHTTETDMLSAAHDAQWTTDNFMGPGCVKAVAPAKVNLFLGVGNRREDGFHLVTDVLHALAFHDVLYFRRLPHNLAKELGLAHPAMTATCGPSDNLTVSIDTCERDGIDSMSIATEDNIIFRAIDSLARATRYDIPEHIAVHVEKHIPYQGGLGGGSSDAAATLAAMGHLWNVANPATQTEDPRVAAPNAGGDQPEDGSPENTTSMARADINPLIDEVAHQLGSDVPFFLYGGCALFEGAGDDFAKTLAPSHRSLVLIKPHGGVSTKAAYATFDEDPRFIDASTIAELRTLMTADEVPLMNNLAPASEALMPPLKDIRLWTEQRPESTQVLLCGSGATTFALTEDFGSACSLAAAAQKMGWWARTTSLSSLKATVLPDKDHVNTTLQSGVAPVGRR